MAISNPWEGPEFCLGTTNSGTRCTNHEIFGLEYCLHHVPDDDLPEAESITGWKRCRHNYGQPDACRQFAVQFTEPAACKNHGANIGSSTSKNAAKREIDQGAIDRLEEIMRDDANAAAIISPPPIGNPLTKLLELAAEIDAMRKFFRDRALKIKESEWRYRGRDAEIVRAELILWERSQERLAQILVNIAKLNIDNRLAAISERRMEIMERAFDEALRASGANFEGQDRARRVLRAELAKAATASLN
jgi:hypothetical protein